LTLSTLDRAAFTAPAGANQAAADAFLGAALARVMRHLGSAATRPPMPGGAPPPQAAAIPERGASPDELLDAMERIMRSSMNQAHPGYMGHMDPMPANASIAGALAASAINNNMLSVEMSPALTALELSLTRELAQRFGLGEAAAGVMASGGTLANLHAIAVARNAAFPVHEGGLWQLGVQPLVLASEAAHTSVQKAAMLLGLGTQGVIRVATDAEGRMRADALADALARIESGAGKAFCVVATAGTTTTGSIDPLPAIAEIARSHALWLHVDAAYGGALVLSGRHRGRLAGIDLADSVTFNPQKWLYVARTSAMCLFRDPTQLERHFRIAAPYMSRADAMPNLGELGVQGTRATEVLKLWLTLLHLGASGCAALIDRGMALAAHLARRVDERAFLHRAGACDTNIVCFRGTPDGVSPARRDAWNTALARHLLAQCNVFVSVPEYRGACWLRAVLLNPHTDEARIDEMFRHIDSFHAGRSH